MPSARRRVLLVSYDLKSPEPGKYDQLFELLKGSPGWSHYLASTWLLVSEDMPEALTDRMHPLLAEGDRILIVEVAENYSGWLPQKAWEWVAGAFKVAKASTG